MTAERNDPTSAGFTPPADAATRLSCNEVEALCTKAARGAGLSWGMAEEAGFAARWLYERGIDGPGALLARLDSAADAPDMLADDGVLQTRGNRRLCPIAVGASLSDHAALCAHQLGADVVSRPLLVLPFVHQIAQASGQTMALITGGKTIFVSPEGGLSGPLTALATTDAGAIAVSAAPKGPAPDGAQRNAAAPEPDTLTRLDVYAMETTVPASAASRAGAGSGDGDND